VLASPFSFLANIAAHLIQNPVPQQICGRRSLSATMRKKFGRKMRLNTHDVANVLKRGKRVRSQPSSHSDQTASIKSSEKLCIEARVITRPQKALSPDVEACNRVKSREESREELSGARLAIAVPKRLLKKAVERNLVKRWMREALRQHAARKISIDVLLTLTAKINLKIAGERVRVKQQINDLLATVDDLSTKRKLPTRN
jgi:ribonuclease P protein component